MANIAQSSGKSGSRNPLPRILGIGCGGIMAISALVVGLFAIFGPSSKELAVRRKAQLRHDDSIAVANMVADSLQHQQDSVLRQAAFDALPKEARDSIMKVRKDSIALIISDSLKMVRDEQRLAQARRDSVRKANTPVHYDLPKTETYNGHEIFIGPRGGRYYLNDNGNKTYIH